ncbi:MAG: alpha/beta hydrolase, partial [Muribaculaceae bacterium]|nr:alpha/beta hydrolase [Muribaculaceae bacterium]
LFYPVLRAGNEDSPSWKEYSVGYGLDGTIMEAFNRAYVGNRNPEIPLISPLCADEASLALLPPTLIINAERDILCAQGEDMFQILKKSGVHVRREVFDGAVHLFITVKGQPTAFSRAIESTAGFLKTN